jgi:hypothetical protein
MNDFQHYYNDIDELKQQYNTQLEIKADARLTYTKYLVILSTLASQLSTLKNTASLDNKINSLLSLNDEQMATQCQEYFSLMKQNEVIYKNARDRIRLIEMNIQELWSRRRTERDIKN